MKKKNKGKKALTAVGAIVAAGLTPGIIAATPGCMPVQSPSVEVTAADAVAIDGQAYSFDELYAMQQISQRGHLAPNRSQPQAKTQTPSRTRPQTRPVAKYAAPPPPRPQDQHTTLYGVPRPHMPVVEVVESAADTIRADALEHLIDYCAQLIDADARGILITPDSDLTHELGMNEDELKALKAEIEDVYGVEVSHHRFRLIGQLNTLRLITEYITRIKTIWD